MVRNRVPNNMETTFYDENSFCNRLGSDVSNLKRSLTLDLDASRGSMKRPRYSQSVVGAPVLSSPDLHKLKLGSPELEKMIIAQQLNGMTATPTPTTHYPSMVNNKPTIEQELYARGFVTALEKFHHNPNDSSDLSGSSMQAGESSLGITYTNLEPNGPGVSHGSSYLESDYSIQLSSPDPSVIVKDEPQTVPSIGSTPPLSPIDMECQEKIKLERKRQRNRVAASKCRRRKLERISRLEDKVKHLKGENSDLGNVVHKLKDQVCQLKEQVMEHVTSGCQIIAAHY